MLGPEFQLPEEATIGRLYEIYRANNKPEQNVFREMERFNDWLELNYLVFDASPVEIGMAIQSFNDHYNR